MSRSDEPRPPPDKSRERQSAVKSASRTTEEHDSESAAATKSKRLRDEDSLFFQLTTGLMGSVKDQIGSVKDQIGSVKDQIGSVREQIGSQIGTVKDQLGTVKDQLRLLTRWPLKMVGVMVLNNEQLARLSPEQSGLFRAAGRYLHELRELAGLTRDELADALDIEDKTVLDALEQGTAALSFELILRLSSVLARNDPLPFVIRLARTYDPDVWQFLHDWGVGRIPLQYERERSFVNILRARDESRQLDDADFEALLALTRQAFELGLEFYVRERQLKTAREAEPPDTL